jgi:prepilin-type N-terminal cleavage/methylation domain-containing protein
VRSGFTLIELMVSLLVIGILLAMSAAAVSKYIAVGQTSSTESTIRKVYTRLQSQRASVMRAAETEDMVKTVGASVTGLILAAAGTDQDAGRRARVIYVKLRLRQEFPITFAEALNPTPLPPKSGFVKAFASTLTGKDSVSGLDYQSSACLLAALRTGRQGSDITPDDFGSSSVRYMKDTSSGNPQIPALIDGWDDPLWYYRWPTSFAEVDSLMQPTQPGLSGVSNFNSSTIIRDPEDPLGLLMNTTWYASPGRTTFEGWCHPVHNATGQYAYYTLPVIVSAGPNKHFGLLSPGTDATMSLDTTAGNINKDTDNIYSFRLKAPGARGD